MTLDHTVAAVAAAAAAAMTLLNDPLKVVVVCFDDVLSLNMSNFELVRSTNFLLQA